MTGATLTFGSNWGEPRDSKRTTVSDLEHRGRGGVGIVMRQAKRLIMERCHLSGWDVSMRLERAAWEGSFEHCFFGGDVGVEMLGTNNNLTWQLCVFRNRLHAVVMQESWARRGTLGIVNNLYWRCKFNSPVVVLPHAGNPIRDIAFEGCQIEQCETSPVSLGGPWEQWSLRGGYAYRPRDGSPIVDIRHEGGPLIIDGVDFGWLPRGQTAIRCLHEDQVVLRDVRWKGPGELLSRRRRGAER